MGARGEISVGVMQPISKAFWKQWRGWFGEGRMVWRFLQKLCQNARKVETDRKPEVQAAGLGGGQDVSEELQ